MVVVLFFDDKNVHNKAINKTKKPPQKVVFIRR